MVVHEFHRFAMLCFTLLGSYGVTTTPALSATTNPTPSQPIPWHQLGSQVTAQYSGDGLGVVATPRGAQLRCVLQKLEGEVTANGLSLSSTVPDARDQLHVTAVRIGRDGGQNLVLAKHGTVQVVDAHAHYLRPGLTEEFSVTADGIRQDFLVTDPPAGTGPLRLQLALQGARAEVSPDGAQLVLNESGRKLNYNRLRVTDATGRELAAWFEITGQSKIQPVLRSITAEDGNLKSKIELAVVVEDAGALYPLRIDPTFSDANWISMGGFPGANNTVRAVVVDGAGNLYIGGDFTAVGDVVANYIAKWNGSSWSALGSGVNYVVYALAVSGSDLYAGGDFTTAGGSPANYVAKWDGSSWGPLGSGMDQRVFALAVSGSDLYAGGLFDTADGNQAYGVAKWNGSSWSALGAGTYNVYALAVSGSDLYVGGAFNYAGGSRTEYIAKWDGNSWSTLGSGMNGYVYALAVSGGDLYAGGSFGTAGGSAANRIAKWNGSSWSAIGSGVGFTVYALAVSGNDLYAGGDFTDYLAKWNGSSWSALGSGVNGNVRALAVSGSDLYAGGALTTAGGRAAGRIAKWNGSGWSALGSGMNVSSVNNSILAVVVSGSDLYVGGRFTTAGANLANYVAKWNGSNWSALGSGMNGAVDALAVSGTHLYAGGAFTTAGGTPANYIAKWDGNSWSALGSGMWRESHLGLYPPFVTALAVSGSDLYAGGWFTTAGGSNVYSIAKWNGSGWSALGSGMGFGQVYALGVSGANLYAGGSFTTAGGTPVTNVAQWNGNSWSALGSGMNGSVRALAVSGSDLYAGGYFATAGGSPANYIARWNGSSWSALGSGMNDSVQALAVSGNDLYAGGAFTNAGGLSAKFIAKWDESSWSPLGSGMNGSVQALALSGSDLYAGGQFTTAGGKFSAYFAKARIGSAAESISASGSSATIHFSGVVGYEYHVQRTDSLTPPMTWTTLTASPLAPADDGLFTFVDTRPPPGTAYYRLVEN